MRFSVRISSLVATVATLYLFASAAAIAQIAPGVTQSAAHTATVRGKVTTSAGAPVAGANVKLSGEAAILTTRTDSNGVFAFTSVPWGTYTISASSTLGLASRSGVTLNGDTNVSIQYLPPSSLRTIAHVSTSSAGASINVTPASITSISPSAYALQGNSTWTQLLDRVPGVVVNGDLEGGEQVTSTVPGSLIQPQVISINGALPYETSVTLDGMPLESQTVVGGPGTGYDLSNLPLAIFPQADIVRGPGANAPSIVDSIGGSLVLHAPGFVDQNRVEYSVSNDMYGGIFSNLVVTQRIGKLSVTATYGVNDSPGPYGSSTSVWPDSYLAGYAAFIPNWLYAPKTIDGLAFHGCTGTGSCGGSLNCNQVPGEGHVVYGQGNYCGSADDWLFGGVPFSTAWSEHHGALGISYNIARGVTAKLFYAGTTGQEYEPSTGVTTYFSPAAGYSGSLTPGYHLFTDLHPNELYQGSSLLEETVDAFVGRGVLRLAAVQNYSWSDLNSPGDTFLPNGSYPIYGSICLGAATGVAGCPDGGTPTMFNGSSGTFLWNKFWDSYDQASRNRDWLASYSEQIGTSATAGASYSYSYYNNPVFSRAFELGASSVLADTSSADTSTLTELRLNFTDQPTERLYLDASWYFAQGFLHVQKTSGYVASPTSPWTDSHFPYNAPRIGLSWLASQNFVIRAAAGGGFALPPLGDLLGTSSFPISCFGGICQEDVTNYNLKPETAFSFDVGTDFRLQRDTTLSFDLYRTNLYGQFFTTTQTSTYLGQPLYITQYNNLQQSRYEGINLSIRSEPPAGWYWGAALGLTHAYIVSLPSGFYNGASCPNTPCNNVWLIPGENYSGATYTGLSPVPYANGAATIGYRWQPHEFVDVSPTYYGNNNAYFEPAFMEFDAHASYPIGRRLSLFATFSNITGIHDGEYQYIGPPAVAAPTVGHNDPVALYTIPYGPRALIVTLQYDGP